MARHVLCYEPVVSPLCSLVLSVQLFVLAFLCNEVTIDCRFQVKHGVRQLGFPDLVFWGFPTHQHGFCESSAYLAFNVCIR